jgi:hypothetical protein
MSSQFTQYQEDEHEWKLAIVILVFILGVIAVAIW